MAYTQKEKDKIINTICDRISEGESLRSVLLDKDMPSSKTFYEWIDKNEEKIKQYARATEDRSDKIFDEIMEIADKQGVDEITLEDGRTITNHNVINRSRLQVDARKWILSKLNPKKYGDKLEVETTIKTKLLELPPDFDPTKEPE